MHLIELCFDPFYYPELQSNPKKEEESKVKKTPEDEEIDTYDDASEY